jgi:hypothetical protein
VPQNPIAVPDQRLGLIVLSPNLIRNRTKGIINPEITNIIPRVQQEMKLQK